jgi:hypothetical protein
LETHQKNQGKQRAVRTISNNPNLDSGAREITSDTARLISDTPNAIWRRKNKPTAKPLSKEAKLASKAISCTPGPTPRTPEPFSNISNPMSDGSLPPEIDSNTQETARLGIRLGDWGEFLEQQQRARVRETDRSHASHGSIAPEGVDMRFVTDTDGQAPPIVTTNVERRSARSPFVASPITGPEELAALPPYGPWNHGEKYG